MNKLSEFGGWLREERRRHALAYKARGGTISRYSEGPGEFGAYRRTAQWFRNLFVEHEAGALDRGWGEGWASDVPEEVDEKRLAVYLRWLDGYIANWSSESDFEKAFPQTADPEKYRAGLEIRDKFLETFPHLKSPAQDADAAPASA